MATTTTTPTNPKSRRTYYYYYSLLILLLVVQHIQQCSSCPASLLNFDKVPCNCGHNSRHSRHSRSSRGSSQRVKDRPRLHPEGLQRGQRMQRAMSSSFDSSISEAAADTMDTMDTMENTNHDKNNENTCTTTTLTTTNSNSSNKPNNSNKPIKWAIIGLGDVCTQKSGPAFYKSNGSTLVAVMRRTPGAARAWVEANIANINNTDNADNAGNTDNAGNPSKGMPREVAENIGAFESVYDLMDCYFGVAQADADGDYDEGGGLDAIYVATPPGSHLDVVKQIVSYVDGSHENDGSHRTHKKKPKAVYVEKPVGRCAWETRVIAEELSSRGILFFPAYVSRAHERTRSVRDLLEKDGKKEGVCGEKVTRVRYRMKGSGLARGLDGSDDAKDGSGKGGGGKLPWRLDAQQSGGGLLMDMGCHLLDRLDYLFGPLMNVKSNVSRKGSGASYPLVEDYVSMTATIGPSNWSVIPSEGASVECTWDFSPSDDDDHDNDDDNEQVDELIIEGPDGSLSMAGMGASLPIYVKDPHGSIIRTIELEPVEHAAQSLIQSITDELRGVCGVCGVSGVSVGSVGMDSLDQVKSVKSPARAENAIRTSEVLDAILNSYYGGRHDEFWTRPESWPGLKTVSYI